MKKKQKVVIVRYKKDRWIITINGKIDADFLYKDNAVYHARFLKRNLEINDYPYNLMIFKKNGELQESFE